MVIGASYTCTLLLFAPAKDVHFIEVPVLASSDRKTRGVMKLPCTLHELVHFLQEPWLSITINVSSLMFHSEGSPNQLPVPVLLLTPRHRS